MKNRRNALPSLVMALEAAAHVLRRAGARYGAMKLGCSHDAPSLKRVSRLYSCSIVSSTCHGQIAKRSFSLKAQPPSL